MTFETCYYFVTFERGVKETIYNRDNQPPLGKDAFQEICPDLELRVQKVWHLIWVASC